MLEISGYFRVGKEREKTGTGFSRIQGIKNFTAITRGR